MKRGGKKNKPVERELYVAFIVRTCEIWINKGFGKEKDFIDRNLCMFADECGIVYYSIRFRMAMEIYLYMLAAGIWRKFIFMKYFFCIEQ